MHSDKMMDTKMNQLKEQPLAFTTCGDDSSSGLISASSRIVVQINEEDVLLNVEIFDFSSSSSKDDSNKSSGSSSSSEILILVIPGICESVETKGVQAIVQQAKATAATTTNANIRVAVVELEGHGLSSGTKGLCTSFDRLVQQVVETLHQIVSQLYDGRQQAENLSIYLIGNSLGGALAIYAAQQIMTSEESSLPLKGIIPIAPAVGMNPKMIPPAFITTALKGMAWLLPSTQLSLTPLEDPTHYNCPSTTQRNFTGHWPLGTSKMLLEITSQKIPNDVATGNLSLQQIPNVLVVAGQTDTVVPLEAIENFYQQISATTIKELLVIPKTGHDLLFRSKSAKQITKTIFDWIFRLEEEQQ